MRLHGARFAVKDGEEVKKFEGRKHFPRVKFLSRSEKSLRSFFSFCRNHDSSRLPLPLHDVSREQCGKCNCECVMRQFISVLHMKIQVINDVGGG